MALCRLLCKTVNILSPPKYQTTNFHDSHIFILRWSLFISSASMFAAMTRTFCNHMNWWEIGLVSYSSTVFSFFHMCVCGLNPLLQILDRYIERLSFGVRQELLPLMELDGVKQFRARALYDAGFCSIQTIAHARPDDLLKARLGAFFSKQYTHTPFILCLSFFGLSHVYYCQTYLY